MVLTTDAADGDEPDSDDGTYHFSDPDGSYADARLHRRERCRVAIRAPGAVRPVSASSVDESDTEWCPHCAPGMGEQYPVPDRNKYDIVDAGGGEFRLHLPGDVRVRFDAVRKHPAGFFELVRDGEVMGTVGPTFDAWPGSVAEEFKEFAASGGQQSAPQVWE